MLLAVRSQCERVNEGNDVPGWVEGMKTIEARRFLSLLANHPAIYNRYRANIIADHPAPPNMQGRRNPTCAPADTTTPEAGNSLDSSTDIVVVLTLRDEAGSYDLFAG